MKRWVCERMPGHVFSEPGHVRCPACRELPAAEHAAALADEFVRSWQQRRPHEFVDPDMTAAVFADLLERKVIE